MGRFLDAAYKVLESVEEPLSAKEIVEHAISRGWLRTRGKTPAQTMKSKLSTDILTRRERSLFMRTQEATFALRAWDSKYTEFTADRYQQALFDEDIIVFPKSSLPKYIPTPGLYTGELDSRSLMNECATMRRREAEVDDSVIQLVSVFLITHGQRYLTFKRTKRLPESRLHGYYSMAFGGHLNPDDVRPLLNIFEPRLGEALLIRELSEEIKLQKGELINLNYRGLLYDVSRPISRQHLGITYVGTLKTGTYEIGERGFLMDPKFETLDEIFSRINDFENWSVLLAKEEAMRWKLLGKK